MSWVQDDPAAEYILTRELAKSIEGPRIYQHAAHASNLPHLMANSINNRFARRGSRCVRVTAAGPLLAAFTGTLGVAVASTLASSTIPPISQGGKIANRRGDRKTQATKENAPSALSMIWTARGGGVDDHRDDEVFRCYSKTISWPMSLASTSHLHFRVAE